MTNPSHSQKVESLARKHRSQGGEVLVEPQSDQLPFDMGGYRPDLVVKRADGTGLIIEVKTTDDRIPLDKFTEISGEVRRHQGWRFVLVTLSDLSFSESDEFLSWDEISARARRAEALLEAGDLDAATLLLWAVFETAMRRLAVQQAIPAERMRATKVRDHLYTAGLISPDDYDLCKAFLRMRNYVAHGIARPIDRSLIERFLRLTHNCIEDWQRSDATT